MGEKMFLEVYNLLNGMKEWKKNDSSDKILKKFHVQLL